MSTLKNITLSTTPDITDVQDNFNTLNNDKLEVLNIIQGENIQITVDGKNITISSTGGGGGTGVDGISLQYNWDGTSLGIKREDEINYTYVDLKGVQGLNGTNGKSSYQSWLDLGNTGTEQDFINSINGTNGNNGKDIEIQSSGTHIQYRYVGDLNWINLVSLESLKGADGVQGIQGEKGDTGETGLSSYDLWLQQGNTGTVDDFLLSIKGEQGNGLKIDGVVDTQTSLPLTGVIVGNAFLVTETNLIHFVKTINPVTYTNGVSIASADIQEEVEQHIANVEKHRNIYFSDVNPSDEEGSDGDIWFVYVPFRPSQVTGAILCLDATNLALVDNAQVATWHDESGKNNHVTQGNASYRPVYKVNIQNGLPMVYFTDDRLVASSRLLNSSEFTIFAVVKGGTQPVQALISQHDGSATVGRTVFISTSGTDKARLFFNNGAGFNLDTTTTVFNNTCKIVTSRSNGLGLSSVLVNGVEEVSQVGQVWTPMNTLTAIGGFNMLTGGNGYVGYIGEILIYNTYLTEGDRQLIEQYLANKWGAY